MTIGDPFIFEMIGRGAVFVVALALLFYIALVAVLYLGWLVPRVSVGAPPNVVRVTVLRATRLIVDGVPQPRDIIRQMRVRWWIGLSHRPRVHWFFGLIRWEEDDGEPST